MKGRLHNPYARPSFRLRRHSIRLLNWMPSIRSWTEQIRHWAVLMGFPRSCRIPFFLYLSAIGSTLSILVMLNKS
jgi:hypothetical protein